MKISANRASLLAALVMCKSAAAAKSPQVVLQTVLIEPGDGEVLLSATDLFVGARVGVAAKITGDREPLSVDAGEIADRVRAIATEDVTLDIKDGTVTVTGGKRKFKLLGSRELPPTRPELPEGAPQVEMAPGKLAALFNSSGHAVGDESRNPALACIRFVWSATQIEASSADGHRLVVEKIDHPCSGSGKVLIPGRAVGEIRKLCDGGGQLIRIWFDGPHLFAEIDGATVWAKLQDPGAYPAIENAITDRLPGAMVVSRMALVDAAKAISISSGRVEGHTQIDINGSKNRLRVSGSDSVRGEGSEDLDADYSGHDWSLTCNSPYLVSALNACACDTVAISIGGPLDPIRIDPSEPQAGRSIVAIIAPTVK